MIVLDLSGSTGSPPEAIRTWFPSPISALGDRVPLDMLREGQNEELIETLSHVLEGMPG
ncbi:antitoxin Xre/MbcA/ParS toxin-binding domain-containing protein [Deinococcus hopiensis]|uniref:Antitoxin Xre/MbcA/ParS-like toxin-binding domain-containing protein n=1 Tax=Deinococcus hopiensis KR-140 TaxID=695939 RepID=A0A1W1UK38_9DEIO|nr:antitoxin Xre/MbcA/ParS toxin-binding domain-containing protein [Deinococcus hopiensis]SMB81161.1 Protein of unknown function [Deinococcus hopiensis KR-140]